MTDSNPEASVTEHKTEQQEATVTNSNKQILNYFHCYFFFYIR